MTKGKSEHERITVIENQMDKVLTQLRSIVSNLDNVTATLNIPQIPFMPSFTGFQAALFTPTLATALPIAPISLLSNAALLFTGPNALKGPVEERRRCDGTVSVAFTERFGMAVTEGRRIITVTNSDKSICEIIVTAEAPGGAPVENPAEEGEIDTMRLAPGATDVLQVILVKGEQVLIQCPDSQSLIKPPCSYALRVDRVPA